MSLEEFLLQRLESEDRVEVVGVASDFCVKAAITGFVRLGYPTIVWEDLCYGIDNPIREVLTHHRLLSPFFLRQQPHESREHQQQSQQEQSHSHHHHHHHYQDELQKEYRQQQQSHTHYPQEQIHRRLELQQRILNHNRSKRTQVNDIRLMSYTHDNLTY